MDLVKAIRWKKDLKKVFQSTLIDRRIAMF